MFLTSWRSNPVRIICFPSCNIETYIAFHFPESLIIAKDQNGCIIFDALSFISCFFCISFAYPIFCYFMSDFSRSCPCTRARAVRQQHVQEPATSQLQQLHIRGHGCGDGQAPSGPALYGKIVTQAMSSPSGGL